MKKKFIAVAFVFGIVLAPTTATASDLTTNQGGTPIYTCPQGTEKSGNNCITAESTVSNVVTTEPNLTIQKVKGTQIDSGCSSAATQGWWLNANGYVGADRQIYYDGQCSPGFTNYAVFYLVDQQVLSCPSTYTLNGNICQKTIEMIVPQSSSPANISGTQGGFSVASVTGFLSPVWNFLTTKLLPAIFALVILGIGVRLSIGAVRKYSKVS